MQRANTPKVIELKKGRMVCYALKKEKIYKIQTEQMPMAQVKSIVFRYIMTYYNRIRIYTGNPSGLPPALYRQAARGLAAQSEDLGCSYSARFLTSPIDIAQIKSKTGD